MVEVGKWGAQTLPRLVPWILRSTSNLILRPRRLHRAARCRSSSAGRFHSSCGPHWHTKIDRLSGSALKSGRAYFTVLKPEFLEMLHAEGSESVRIGKQDVQAGSADGHNVPAGQDDHQGRPPGANSAAKGFRRRVPSCGQHDGGLFRHGVSAWQLTR
jgi:hypothetical protein